MQKKIVKRNTPVATLIKKYVDKTSGKVSDARKEIKWRFRALDWKDQKKIISAFLDAGKVDRHWAYSELLDFWDKSFENKVQELWEQYHEQRCKWVVIRYLPFDYIKKNLHDFTEERDYYFACLRLAKDKDFVIEREKLSHTDYLAVLYHTGRTIDEKEGLDILFQIMHVYCVKGIESYEVRIPRGEADIILICPIYLQNIRLAIYYLEKLDCSKSVQEFEKWNGMVRKAVKDSKEFKRRSAHPYIHYDMERRRLDILRKYSYLALDEKFKKPSDPSIDDILKPVKSYAEGERTVFDVFPMSPHNNSASELSKKTNEEDFLPF